MKKKIVFSALLLALVAGLVAAQVNTDGVKFKWEGGDVITASSIDGKSHILSLAVTISQAGREACYYPDIQVPARGEATWNVKDKVAKNATIVSVSVTACK